MMWLFMILVVIVGLTTYVSALVLALLTVRRTSLEERLRSIDRGAQGEWLFAHASSAQLAMSLMRTILRLSVFVLVLVEVGGMDDSLTIPNLLIAGAISVPLLWVCSSVIGSALARHASVGLVATSLPLLRVVTVICSPFTGALSFLDEAVRRLTGANLREDEALAEAELLRSIGDTHREGVLDEKSATLLENVVEFSSTDVAEVMTPRTEIDGIELTDDLLEIREFIVKVGHSRIPVYEENLDHIVGVLYVKDLVPHLGEAASAFELRPILRQPIVVPETRPVRELLADFQRSEVHMAMVIDEYGGTAGIVTIEDVLEEIVGEIHDEHDLAEDDEPTLVRVDDQRAEVDGRFHIDDLNEQLGLDLPEDAEFDTVGGYLLAQLGRVPEVGEVYEDGAARFTAIEATPTQVQRIAVELLQPVDGAHAQE